MKPPPAGPGRTKGALARLMSIVSGHQAGFADRLFDARHGTETSRFVEPKDMEVVGPHRDRGIRYQPTRARALRRVLRDLRIAPGEIFVDIGCGKGRVLLLAHDHGFRKVVGVEYAAALCDIARKNLHAAAKRRGAPIPVEIHCCDAADYGFGADETVIYLFNPFDAVVLAKMMERLAESLRRKPRKAWLIYLFPRWHEVIESQGLFTLAALHVEGASEFAVFTHDPRAPPP